MVISTIALILSILSFIFGLFNSKLDCEIYKYLALRNISKFRETNRNKNNWWLSRFIRWTEKEYDWKWDFNSKIDHSGEKRMVKLISWN